MVRVLKGTLIKWYAVWLVIKCSEEAVKEIILSLNKDENFVIYDLDKSHLFVKSEAVDELRRQIDLILDVNVYRAPTEQPERQ